MRAQSIDKFRIIALMIAVAVIFVALIGINAYSAKLQKYGEDVKAADLSTWGQGGLPEHTLSEPATWEIRVTDPAGESFVLGWFGNLTWLGAALYGKAGKAETCFAFSIDVDDAACRKFGISDRSKLFDNRQEFLTEQQGHHDRQCNDQSGQHR